MNKQKKCTTCVALSKLLIGSALLLATGSASAGPGSAFSNVKGNSSLIVMQDKRTITGVIVDEKGESVLGATIRIKGQSVGTTSNVDGEFQLARKQGDILVVSYIGSLVSH